LGRSFLSGNSAIPAMQWKPLLGQYFTIYINFESLICGATMCIFKVHERVPFLYVDRKTTAHSHGWLNSCNLVRSHFSTLVSSDSDIYLNLRQVRSDRSKQALTMPFLASTFFIYPVPSPTSCHNLFKSIPVASIQSISIWKFFCRRLSSRHPLHSNRTRNKSNMAPMRTADRRTQVSLSYTIKWPWKEKEATMHVKRKRTRKKGDKQNRSQFAPNDLTDEHHNPGL
jgi:hypothetical protein